jgi:uncharacterized membrane-anchored protein YitT (DUF2179 family)
MDLSMISSPACFKVNSRESWKRIAWNLFLLTVGNLIYAAGINSIIIPQHFLSGGVMGASLIAHYLIPALNAGYAYFLINIPLFLLGWFTISRRFILYSAFGRFGTIAIINPILAAILGGLICGAGGGIVLRSQGSAGGLDIMSVYLHKKFGVRIGSTATLVSAVVLCAGAVFRNFDAALYSLVYVFTNGKVVDSVLTGFNQRKTVFIISDCHQQIAAQILSGLHRGVTYLDGSGGYSGCQKKVIFSIITLTELSKLKQLVFDADPAAFVVVNDTMEVLGYRHGDLHDF